jgi:hypothetical protein
VSPPMKTRRRSRRGAATSPARQSTGATCQGRPRRRLPMALKCRHRGVHMRPCVTRMWARARDKQLALPVRTSGQSALAWRPAGQVPPSHREPHPAMLTPRGGRRSGRLAPAIFTMAPTAPTWTPCRGAGRGGSRRTWRRHRAHRRQWSLASPRGACSRYLSGAVEPRTSMFPSSPAGAKDQLRPSQRPEGQPPSGRGSVLPPLRQRTEAEQPPSSARSVQPPSRARRAARRRSPECAPRCKFSSSDLVS